MKGKTHYWFVSIALIGALLLFGCSSGGGGGNNDDAAPTLTDYSTGQMVSVSAVKADGSKTVLPATADTHEVETDGNWIVWKGRTINMGYFDGTDLKYLNTGLPGSVTPWAFNEHIDSPVGFDGTTVVFVARNVATGGLKFYYMTPGATAKAIALPASLLDTDLEDFTVYVSGTLAVVSSDTAKELHRADLSDASPAFEELLVSNEPRGAIGKYLAVINDGAVEIYDMTGAFDQTPVILTGDGDGGTDPMYFRQANGFFTWVENGLAYYFEPGVDADSSAIYAAGAGQTDPVAGPDFFLWEESGSLWYLAEGDDTPEAVGYNAQADDLEVGRGFFAYVDQDDDGNDQVFVYDLADLAAVEGVQVTENGEGAEEEDSDYFQVDGNWVYHVFEYRDVHNPSRIAVAYNAATDTLREVGEGAFQQIAMPRTAGGKAIMLCRDHSFRLVAKRAAEAGKPVVVTPINLFVQNFSVTDGILAFMALDRNRYLNNPDLLQEVIDDEVDGDELSEIYYIDLDAAGSIVKVTANRIEEVNPQTDGTYITWSEDSGDEPSAWAYHVADKTKTNMGSGDDVKVAVDRGIAVWEDYNSDLSRTDVRYFNLNTGVGAFLGSEGVDNCPNIANGIITWEDDGNVYYYDLNAASPAIVNIYATAPAYAYEIYSPVRSDGTYLTWLEYRTAWDHDGDGLTADIAHANVVVVHDLNDGTTFDIQAADWSYTSYAPNGYSWEWYDRRINVCFPSIANGIVTFGASGYDAENADRDKEVFSYDLNAAAPALLRVTSDAEGSGLWDSRPRTGAGLVVWRTGGSDEWEDVTDGEAWRGKSVAAAYVD